MKKPSITIALTLFSSHAFAMFCPTGFNQVNLGQTIDQVTEQCGKPDSIKTSKVTPPHPQEWNYYVKPDPSQPSSLKMTFAFDATGKVLNITVNGQTLVSSTICGGTVNLGDPIETVKKACGEPAFTNQSSPQAEENAPPPTLVTEFKYNTTPPTTYIFENGKLKERKR